MQGTRNVESRWLRPAILACLPGLFVVAVGCACGNGASDASVEDAADGDDAGSDVRPDVGPDVSDDAPPDEGADDRAVGDVDTDVPEDGEVWDGDADESGDEFDADSLLPVGCRFVLPATGIFNGWSGRYSIDAGKFVWRWIDSRLRPEQDVLMERDLATGLDREVLRRTYPEVIDVPALHAGSVVFFSQTGEGDGYSVEVFLVDLASGTPTQLTSNSSADGYPKAGEDHVVYYSRYDPAGPGIVEEYRFVDVVERSEQVISDRTAGGEIEFSFDGYRWVAFRNDTTLYKFDLTDPGAGPQVLVSYPMYTMGLAFDRNTGVLVAAVDPTMPEDDYRLEVWDVAAGTMTVLVDDPDWQAVPDVDGHVVVYEQMSTAGTELRIVDRDTGAKRTVMPLDTYYGVGIWERWIAFNNVGRYGDSLIICDLVAGGHMSADLHVIPE